MSPLTVEQLHTFHAQDREIFSKLVIKFSRPPAESLLVMATWFWLEDFGFENIFSTIISLRDPLIIALANEAVSCYQCVDSGKPPNEFTRIPLTARLMKKDISLQKLYKKRYSAIIGIKNFLTTICSRIFSDILQQVLPRSSSSFFLTTLRHPLIIPGFPHPTFGSINVMHDVLDGDNFSNNNMFLYPNGLWRWNATCIATENERTMFVTFSRGFPVTQAEVRQLFTDRYGDNCVERVYMPQYRIHSPSIIANSNSQQQSLFARVVLNSVTTVDRVLEGMNLRKFRINGKHIWARKFNEKRDGAT